MVEALKTITSFKKLDLMTLVTRNQYTEQDLEGQSDVIEKLD